MMTGSPIDSSTRRPPRADPSHFVVGQDRHGRWIAVETHGLGGGIFRSRRDAVRYALAETLHRPEAVTLCDDRIEFRI